MDMFSHFNADDQVINLEDGNGGSYRCRPLVLFRFEEKEYSLLLNLEKSETIIMQLIVQGDQEIFRTIESDEQFRRVSAHCKDILRELAEEDDSAVF
jgi:hypothetical protein